VRRCLVLAAVLVCAACGGSHASQSKTVTQAQLASAVLQPGDLPGFSQFAEGAQVRSDAHPGPRNDPTRFGRTAGWIARYRRSDGSTKGPLVVESRADLFDGASGAVKDLDAYAEEYTSQPGAKEIDPPALGDAARAFAFGSASDHFVLIAWREANVSASVLAEGITLRPGDAERLARKQAKRLSALAR
jgi:hypothetical protein